MIRRRILILIAVTVFMVRAGRCQETGIVKHTTNVAVPTVDGVGGTEWQKAVDQGETAITLDIWSQAVNGSGMVVLSTNVTGDVSTITAGTIATTFTGSLVMTNNVGSDYLNQQVAIPPGYILEPVIGQPGTYRMEYEVETTKSEITESLQSNKQ